MYHMDFYIKQAGGTTTGFIMSIFQGEEFWSVLYRFIFEFQFLAFS